MNYFGGDIPTLITWSLKTFLAVLLFNIPANRFPSAGVLYGIFRVSFWAKTDSEDGNKKEFSRNVSQALDFPCLS